MYFYGYLKLNIPELGQSTGCGPCSNIHGASMIMNLQGGPKAIAIFDEIRSAYPSYEKAPLCLFFTGYVQENVLGDIDQARDTYTLFIETYPDHDFADDAQASIDNLGKTPEQMIQQFETDQQQSDEGK